MKKVLVLMVLVILALNFNCAKKNALSDVHAKAYCANQEAQIRIAEKGLQSCMKLNTESEQQDCLETKKKDIIRRKLNYLEERNSYYASDLKYVIMYFWDPSLELSQNDIAVLFKSLKDESSLASQGEITFFLVSTEDENKTFKSLAEVIYKMGEDDDLMPFLEQITFMATYEYSPTCQGFLPSQLPAFKLYVKKADGLKEHFSSPVYNPDLFKDTADNRMPWPAIDQFFKAAEEVRFSSTQPNE